MASSHPFTSNSGVTVVLSAGASPSSLRVFSLTSTSSSGMRVACWQEANMNAMDTTKATPCNACAKSRPQVCVERFSSLYDDLRGKKFTPPKFVNIR